MKKRTLKTNWVLGMIAASVLVLITVVCAIYNPFAIAGVVSAMGVIVGGVELSDEQGRFLEAVKGEMLKIAQKEMDGKITEVRMNEMLTTKFTEFAKERNLDEVMELKKALEAQGLELTAIKEKGSGLPVYKSFAQQMKEHIGSKSITELCGVHAKFSVNLYDRGPFGQKVGTITRPADDVYIPLPSYDYQWSWIPQNIPLIRQYADVMPTGTPRAVWFEATRSGSLSPKEEGGAKDQIDFTPGSKSMDAQKIPGIMKFTQEALDDIPSFLMELERELITQINLVEDTQLITGNGTAPNLAGITSYAKAYDLTGVEGLSPDVYGVIKAALTQIQSKNFTPNLVMMNPVDITNMEIAKTATDGPYLLPPFYTNAGMKISGVQIVPNNQITKGYILAGDFTKYHIRDYKDISIIFGYSGAEIESNVMTCVAEKRVVAYCKSTELYAFCYDAIADIQAAILLS